MSKSISEIVDERYDESTASMSGYTIEVLSKLPPRFRAYVTITRRDGKPLEGKDLQLVKEAWPVDKKQARRTKRTATRHATSRTKTTKRKAAKKPNKRK